MGKTILTPKQLDFLEFAQAQSSITNRFYLTGGTALSEFYFKHQLSEDIDTNDLPKMLIPFNPKEMEEFFLKLAKSLERKIFN